MAGCFDPLATFQHLPAFTPPGCGQCHVRELCSADELVTACKTLSPNECVSFSHPANKALLIQSGISTGIHVVCKGLVLESRWDQGRQEPVGQLAGPGGIIDPATALQQPPRGAITATTLMETTLIFVPQALVNKCLQESPQIMRKVLGHLCAQLRLLEVRYYLRSSCDVYARVVHTLLWMADQIGQMSADALTIPLKCDRRVLAQLVGSSPETVSRMMSRLREENLVECREHSIVILNPAQLSQALVDAVVPATGNASPASTAFRSCTAP